MLVEGLSKSELAIRVLGSILTTSFKNTSKSYKVTYFWLKVTGWEQDNEHKLHVNVNSR